MQTILSQSWQKIALKLGAGGAVVGYLFEPELTTYSVEGVGALATAWAGYQSFNWLVEIPHRWKWIGPLHVALRGPLGMSADTNHTRYIKIPRRYQHREQIGKILLPKDFVGHDTKIPTHVIKAKLGLSDCSVSYQLAGRNPHLVITQTPRPPAKVLFADHKDIALAARESAPLLGIGPKSVQVSVDLDAESPHVLVSASTGGGKSVITRTMAAQMLHNGSQLVVLDFKRHSHKWARSLPQVTYCREIAEIHDTLVALGALGHHRNRIVDDWDGADGDEPVGPRLAILLEEANATISKLKRYWTTVRDPRNDPKESPAIDALREILFMGRAVRMHVLLVAQSATAAALGGPEIRECFATRILSRYTQNAWRMLVPEVSPIPRSTRHVGRAQVVLGGVATETQIVFLTPTEAADWATTGEIAPPLNLSRRDSVTIFPQVGETGEVSRDVTPALTLVKSDELYTLASASREGIVPMAPDALRQAKRRDPRFPAGENGLWTADELRRWYRNRPRSA